MARRPDPLPPALVRAPEALGVDRREALERAGLGALQAAADAAVEAHAALASPSDGPDIPRLLHEAATEVLRAVLAELVQGGLAIDQCAVVQARLDAVAPAVEVRELLRVVRTVGIDVVVEHLEQRAHLSRDEEARLRESASRVVTALTGDGVRILPDDRQVLRRLQRTGVDLR